MSEDNDKEETNRKTGLAYAAGFSLFAGVVSGLLAGWLLDRWLGTKPWLLVTGLVLGAAVAEGAGRAPARRMAGVAARLRDAAREIGAVA